MRLLNKKIREFRGPTKTHPFGMSEQGVFGTIFNQMVAHRGYRDETSLTFLSYRYSQDAQLKNYVGTFENPPGKLRSRGVIAGFLRHNQKIWSAFRQRIWKLGGKILPPPQNCTFSRLKIQFRS